MSRMTEKYTKALDAARENGMPGYEHKDTLYRKLNDQGVFWDNKTKEWVKFADQPADAPTPLIMVRVWAANDAIDEAVSTVCGAFGNGYEKILQSDHYPCRPPKQLETRVYLQFKRVERMTKAELIKESDPTAIIIEG